MGKRSYDQAVLARFRDVDCATVLPLLCTHCKADTAFVAVKSSSSKRWHARTEHGEYEILTTGAKWYDTRNQRGGGGAIDLAMHLFGIDFVNAVKLLIRKGI